jgi:hypothetical protein
MTIEQTVEIPADHRLFIDVPAEIPAGRALVRLIPLDTGDKNKINETRKVIFQPKKIDREKAEAAHKRMHGMFKTDGHDVDRFLAWKQSERELEREIDERQRRESEKWRKK